MRPAGVFVRFCRYVVINRSGQIIIGTRRWHQTVNTDVITIHEGNKGALAMETDGKLKGQVCNIFEDLLA